MATCSAKRLCFLAFNFLFLSIGAGLVGFVAWTLATIPNASQFISGAWIFQLTVFCLGTAVTITAFLGCFGGLCQNFCLLKTYVALMVILLFLQIGLVIAIYVEHSQISSIISSSWEGLNDDTKYGIQKELKCCGISNYTEYGADIADYPDSCFRPYDVTNIVDKKMDNLYTANCLDNLLEWINDNVAVWVSSLLAIAVIQLLSAIMSCVYMNRVQKKAQVNPDENIEMTDTDKEAKKGDDDVLVTDLEPAEAALVMASMKDQDKDVISLTEGSVVMGDLEPDHWENSSIQDDGKGDATSTNGSVENKDEIPAKEGLQNVGSSATSGDASTNSEDSPATSCPNEYGKDSKCIDDISKTTAVVGATNLILTEEEESKPFNNKITTDDTANTKPVTEESVKTVSED